jgi:hypothetical protein
MKFGSSIEVIEDLLGRPLYEPEFRFHTFREIMTMPDLYPPPELTHGQFETLAERLTEHWSDTETMEGTPDRCLLIRPLSYSKIHRIP